MKDDFRDFATFPRRCELPSTYLGKWSLGLLGGFIVLTILLVVIGSPTTNGVVLTCIAVAAGSSGVAAAVVATIAIKRRGEQSILMVLSLFMGAFAAMFALGVLVNLVVRA